jgi:hypothetical protein
MLAASFIEMLIFYSCEFVAIVLVAIAGVFVGKLLRDRKNKKNADINSMPKEAVALAEADKADSVN